MTATPPPATPPAAFDAPLYPDRHPTEREARAAIRQGVRSGFLAELPDEQWLAWFRLALARSYPPAEVSRPAPAAA